MIRDIIPTITYGLFFFNKYERLWSKFYFERFKLTLKQKIKEQKEWTNTNKDMK